MAISTRLAKSLIESVLGGKAYTAPSTWYFGLSSSPITNGVIPNGAEPADGTGYQRLAITNNQLVGSTGTGSFTECTTDTSHPLGFVSNAQTLTMNEIISGSEPTVAYFFLATTGENSNNSGASKNVEMWGSFDRSRKLVINSNLIIEKGGAVFEIVNVD